MSTDKRRSIPEETKERAKMMYENGAKVSQIAKHLGVSETSVGYWMNPEKYKVRMKKYIDKNKEAIYEKNKVYRKENPEKSKEYYQKNKERISAKAKIYRENNLEKFTANQKVYYQKNREYIIKREKERYHRNKLKIKD